MNNLSLSHIIGAQAVISIMVGVAVDNLIVEETGKTPTSIPLLDDPAPPNARKDIEQERINIAISLCMLVGIIQVCVQQVL